MIELLMCISLICLDWDVWVKYINYPNDNINIEEIQEVTDVITFDNYIRYWVKKDNSRRHCYSNYDARKYIDKNL